jgi:hypothetical protein
MKKSHSALAVVVACGALSLAPGVASAGSPATGAAPRVMSCLGKGVSKPAEYVLSCADYNSLLIGMHWTSWASRAARGRGTYRANDCTPYCAAGKFHNYPATAKLFAPKETRYGLLYSEATIVYVKANASHSFTEALPLKPL